MHILHLVTNEHAPFFRQQVASLENRGVTAEIRSPSGTRSSTTSRSPVEYGRWFADVARADTGEFDLVHANYGLTAPAALLQFQLPTVLSLWGSDLHGPVGAMSRLCARVSDEVVVMTREMADQLGQPCHVIPHGVDLETFRPMGAEAARRAVGWEEAGHHVLFPYHPGRPVKDFPRAARVVAAANRRLDEPVHLQTVFDVDHDEMVHYYNAADALLLTSRREGSPNVIKEALACNTPIVSRDVGDVSELLEEVASTGVGRTDEALVSALVDVLTRPQPANGRAVVRRLSSDRTAERLLSVYERAMAKSPDDPAAGGDRYTGSSREKEAITNRFRPPK